MGLRLTCSGQGETSSEDASPSPLLPCETKVYPEFRKMEKGSPLTPQGNADNASRLLELLSSLTDQSVSDLQIKINEYLASSCEVSVCFLVLISEEEDEYVVHVIGSHLLPSPLKIPTSNNSFISFLAKKQSFTLEDIKVKERGDIWSILGFNSNGPRDSDSFQFQFDSKSVAPKEMKSENGHDSCFFNSSTSGPTKPLSSASSSKRTICGKNNETPVTGDSAKRRRSSLVRQTNISSEIPSPNWKNKSHFPLENKEVARFKDQKHRPLRNQDSLASAKALVTTTSGLFTSPPSSLLVVPISAPGNTSIPVAACLVDKEGKEGFGTKEVLIVEECFRYVLGLLMNTLAWKKEAALRKQCQSLLTVAKNLFTHLDDLTVLLQEIMTEARQLTDAERCSLFLLDKEHNELVAKVFDGESKEEASGEVRLPASQGIAGHVATTGNLLNIRDAYSHPLFFRGFDDRTGFKTRNILCFPIKEDGDVIGVAELCNKVSGRYFTSFDEEIAMAFSIYCGIAISHSIMYKKVCDTQRRSRLSNELMMFHMKVTKEEVVKIVESDVPQPHELNCDFGHFRFFPRNMCEPQTPLAVVSMLEDLGFINRWRIPKDTLSRFILMVRKGYRDPPYHNWMHAFSVSHWAYLAITNLNLIEIGALTELESLALFVSCMCHDLDHRGTTNSFQVQSNSILASLYSSEGSVMERHHLAQAMCILNTEDCNIFESLSKQEYTECLDLMRDIILATDLAHHLRLVKELRTAAEEGYDKSKPRHHYLLTCLLMTASDLSDQTKDWISTKRVAELIYKEFFTQGDLEKAMGNMPLEMMDREKAFIPELQIQFLDDVAIPVYEMLAKMFPKAQEPWESARASRKNWVRLKDVYQKRKHESTSSLEIFEDESLEQEVANLAAAEGDL